MGFYIDMIILMLTLLLWSLSKDFSKFVLTTVEDNKLTHDSIMLQHRMLSQWLQIKIMYYDLAEFAKNVNNFIGTNVTLFLLEFILDYAVTLDDDQIFIKPNPDLKTVIHSIFYFTAAMAVLYFASEVSTQVLSDTLHNLIFKKYAFEFFWRKIQMATLFRWLKNPRNLRQLKRSELHQIICNLDKHKISLKASNTYPITWSLVAHVSVSKILFFCASF